MCKEPWETVGKTKRLFHTCGQCSYKPPVVQHLLRSQLTPVFSVLGVSCTEGAYIHTAVSSGCLSGLLLLLLRGGCSWCLLLGLHLTLKTFYPNSCCCLPGTAFFDFTSDGEALPDVLLGEVPSHMFFPRGPRKAWDVIASLGMMPSDEGGSETESLYEIEGMNKWILYL